MMSDAAHPPSFYCPISCQVMHDPVVLCDGHSFERRHIARWLEHKDTSPVTGAVLVSRAFFPNHALRNAIEEYFKTMAATHRRAIRSATASQGYAGYAGYEGQEGQEDQASGQEESGLQRCVDALMEMSLTANADLPAEVALKRIVDEARDLIGADVASVFLVDHATQELYSTVNSTGGEIRIPLSAGIAGLVASSGEAVIIADAYADSRFNQAVDKRTGFTTRNILCCPIKTKKGVVVGVAQLINKREGGALGPNVETAAAEAEGVATVAMPFSPEDQRFLLVFASQAAAAIAHSGGTFAEDREAEESATRAAAAAPSADKATKPKAQGEGFDDVSPKAAEKALNDCLEKCFGGWEADVLELSDLTGGRPLATLAEHLLRRNGLVAAFQLDVSKLRRFLSTVEAGYSNGVPYHNKAHAASVVHMTHALLRHGGVAAVVGAGQHFYSAPPTVGADATGAAGVAYPAGALETLACLFAAVVHDLEHLGKNNAFLVKSQHPRAVRYNDAHVNEHHHLAAAFEVLLRPDCNFLGALPPPVFAAFRQLVVALVTATDMAVDKSIVSSFGHTLAQAAAQAAKVDANSDAADGAGDASTSPAAAAPWAFAPACEADAVAALQLVLKAADLGHLALPWGQHLGWVELLEEEFFQQGDAEKALGHPTSFLCDRTAPGVTQSQEGFFNFVVTPLFSTLELAFPEAKPMVKQVTANGAAWAALTAAKA